MSNQAGANLLSKLIRRQSISGIYPESESYRSQLAKLLNRPTCIYAGFDATSESLHVGNLATIMNLMHFHRHGHRVICLIGDATTRIGDPSGHDRDRDSINQQVIAKNCSSIEETIRRIFKNHAECFASPSGLIEPLIVKNSQWYSDKNVIEFVSDIFKKVRVGSVLHKKHISERLKSHEGLNMSEFSYQIFQAYDWLKLRELYDCRLQLGGSDQAGNIYTGHDLIKKELGETDSIGLLSPLITGDSGKKLGKSTSDIRSKIWLQRSFTSPYELYQFFHRTPDRCVDQYLRSFSLYDEPEIEDLVYNHLKKADNVWYCQQKLAEHVCKLVHGEEGLKSAKKITHALHNKNPLDIANLKDDELYELFDKDSIIHLMHTDNLSTLDLIRKANCFRNDMDALRLIEAGGLYINGARVTSINVPITTDLIIGNGVTVMRVGKRNYFLFKWFQ